MADLKTPETMHGQLMEFDDQRQANDRLIRGFVGLLPLTKDIVSYDITVDDPETAGKLYGSIVYAHDQAAYHPGGLGNRWHPTVINSSFSHYYQPHYFVGHHNLSKRRELLLLAKASDDKPLLETLVVNTKTYDALQQLRARRLDNPLSEAGLAVLHEPASHGYKLDHKTKGVIHATDSQLPFKWPISVRTVALYGFNNYPVGPTLRNGLVSGLTDEQMKMFSVVSHLRGLAATFAKTVELDELINPVNKLNTSESV